MTKKYDGQLIYATSDSYGPIEVIELQQKMRSLHFGNKTQQAAMFFYNPNLLVHKYTQAMLTPLCWRLPENVLVLGVGGGSIVKYLLHFLPHVKIDAVELRVEVARVAREYFQLPAGSARLHMHYTSAAEFLANVDESKSYELIIVDLFLTTRGEDVSVGLGEQVSSLQKQLSENGALCINIIGDNHQQFPDIAELSNVFRGNLYAMAVDKSNIVLLASRSPIPQLSDLDFTSNERKFGLPFRQYYNRITAI